MTEAKQGGVQMAGQTQPLQPPPYDAQQGQPPPGHMPGVLQPPPPQPGYYYPQPYPQPHPHYAPHPMQPQPQANQNIIIVSNQQQQQQQQEQTVVVEKTPWYLMCGNPADEECSKLCTLKWIGITLLLLIALPILAAFLIIICVFYLICECNGESNK